MAVYFGYFDVLGYKAFLKSSGASFLKRFNEYSLYQNDITRHLVSFSFHEFFQNPNNVDSFYSLFPLNNPNSRYDLRNVCNVLAVRQALSIINYDLTVRGFLYNTEEYSFVNGKTSFNPNNIDKEKAEFFEVKEKQARFARIILDKQYKKEVYSFYDLISDNIIRKVRTKREKYYINPFLIFYSPISFIKTDSRFNVVDIKNINFNALAKDFYLKMKLAVENQYIFAHEHKKEAKEGFKKAKWLVNEFDRELRNSNLEYHPIVLGVILRYIPISTNSQTNLYDEVMMLCQKALEKFINSKAVGKNESYRFLVKKYRKAFSLKMLTRLEKVFYEYVPINIFEITYLLMDELPERNHFNLFREFDLSYQRMLEESIEMSSSFYGRLLEKKRNDFINKRKLDLNTTNFYKAIVD